MFALLLTTSLLIALNYAFPCCIIHESAATCLAEAGSSCKWLPEGDALLVPSQGIQCVSESWFLCEDEGDCPPAPPPPVAVASECVFETCTDPDISINVAFLIDESGSVGKTNYLTSLDFIEKMVRNDISVNSPISMLSFASGLDRLYHFSDDQNDQKAGALQSIVEERNNYVGGGTCTATGLREVIAEFVNTQWISPTDENILLLMTDGQPNCGGNVCDEKAGLDAAGIEVYIVGVGSGFTKAKVKCLVDQNSIDKHILTIPQFDPRFFYKMEEQLRHVVCPAVFEESLSQKFVQLSGALYNAGYENGQIMFWVAIIMFLMVGVGYYYRGKICNKDGKYQPIINKFDGYQSTV